ncbi:retron St85 family effector protein [Colwellia psychrerythraea]|uniref:Uncharacterized protein n=1 Tax=Colwellia psychrerythraea TaxID=28229 RepID=A0A099KCL9_COLPS|nr:retron St85 family effector protein [Colwellia psychrerythraea]KGJ87333.1 hypothetical protein ND2E_0740 [Colwellia psychrerythraea]
MWFNHPRYLNAKKCFLEEADENSLKDLSNHLPKILFICGGDPKFCFNRHKIEEYLLKHHKDLLFFRAENAWEAISNAASKNTNKVNALDLEKWLAEFSDAVIILVESFGTVAELGAFSISAPLRQKLLPIINNKFEKDESFINTGPVRWVDNDSNFGPTIFTDFSTILTCMPQVVERLSRKQKKKLNESTELFGHLKFSRKEFLFFILYVVTALGPVSEKEICELVSRKIGFGKQVSQAKEISFVLSLCIALGIVQFTEVKGIMLFTCIDYIKLYAHQSTKLTLEKSVQLRAKCLADLLFIDEFRETLSGITNEIT